VAKASFRLNACADYRLVTQDSLADDATVQRLGRAIGIVSDALFLEQGAIRFELLLRNLDRLLDHMPGHAFTARRGGQRAAVDPGVEVLRQQLLVVGDDLGDGGLLGGSRRGDRMGIGREVLEDLVQQAVVAAFLQKDPDHGQVAFGVLVNEVHLHVVVLAIDGVLAQGVEVELHQLELDAVDGDVAVVGDDDGVTVVLQVGLLVVVVELQRQGRADRVGGDDVDRRLAGPVTGGGFQAPLIGGVDAGLAKLAPGGGKNVGGQQQAGGQNGRQYSLDHCVQPLLFGCGQCKPDTRQHISQRQPPP